MGAVLPTTIGLRTQRARFRGAARPGDTIIIEAKVLRLRSRMGLLTGHARVGEKVWQRDVQHALVQLKKSLIADYVVLGGGNAKELKEIPKGVELGNNRNAFLGGVRLWQIDSRTRRPKWQIL